MSTAKTRSESRLIKLGEQLAGVLEQYAALTRKRLALARRGGRLLRAMKREVRRRGQNWLDWLASPEGRRIVKIRERTCQEWMHVAWHWPAIESMMADNPDLIDLGLKDTLKLLRHRKYRPDRVKDLTPDEAQEFLRQTPTKPAAPDKANHDGKELLPLSDYQIVCCGVSGLGAKAGLVPDSLDLAFADAPWDKESLGVYEDIGRFALTYLKPGRPILCNVGTLNLLDSGWRLKEVGLEWVNELSIQLRSMFDQPKLNSIKMRNGHRSILMFAKGRYEAKYWMDDSQDGQGRENNVEEIMYWINSLTLSGELVASLCGGVFTEAVACRRLGRRFVGCDPSARKCQIGRKRLKEVTGLHSGVLYTRRFG
jgi:hypothetical protein